MPFLAGIQWGTFACGKDGMAQISFPLSFGNKSFIFVAQPTDTPKQNECVCYWNLTNAGVQIYGANNEQGSSTSVSAALTGSYFTVGK